MFSDTGKEEMEMKGIRADCKVCGHGHWVDGGAAH